MRTTMSTFSSPPGLQSDGTAIQVQLWSFLDHKNKVSARNILLKVHAVVYLVDHILEHMDEQQLTGAAFIDLKKVFDLVDHHCLLHKLQHYGVRGRSPTWCRNYPTVRLQTVQYGKELSFSLSFRLWCSRARFHTRNITICYLRR